MTEQSRQTAREARRLARRRRWRVVAVVLVILVAGTGINAYLALRPEHVRHLLELIQLWPFLVACESVSAAMSLATKA